MTLLLTVITALGALAGAAIFILGSIGATGAPQEAAAAAMGMAAALIPYVMLRCAQMAEQRTANAELIAALRALKAPRVSEAPSHAPTGIGSGSPRPEAPPVERTHWN